MCLLCLLLIPLSASVIACLSMLAALYFTKQRCTAVLHEQIAAMSAAFEQSGHGFERQIGTVLDERLDRMVEAFKVKIPLAGMFLSKDKEASLKEVARSELMKLVPTVKEKLLSGRSLDSKGGAFAGFMDKVWGKVCWHLFAYCALAGFLCGLVEVLVLFSLGLTIRG